VNAIVLLDLSCFIVLTLLKQLIFLLSKKSFELLQCACTRIHSPLYDGAQNEPHAAIESHGYERGSLIGREAH
jgi:hypothetical protein